MKFSVVYALLPFTFSLFVQLEPVRAVPAPPVAARQTTPIAWPSQTFRTSAFRPPLLKTVIRGEIDPGLLFFAPFSYPPLQNAPIIMSNSGELVWHGAAESVPYAALGFEPQVLLGRPVLVYWNGTLAAPAFQRGYGSISILNSAYELVHRVSLSDEYFVTTDNTSYTSYIDLHEDSLTDRGTMIVTATNITRADLRSVGGPEQGWVIDSLFYEIDVKTNVVLFKWSALDHLDQIPFNESRYPLNGTGISQESPWNYFVLNSAQRYGEDYIISGRYYCSIYCIGQRGEIKWDLNGQKGHSFTLSAGTSFCYQHDVRVAYSTGSSQNPDTLSIQMHNNNNADIVSNNVLPSTGLVLSVNLLDFTASTSRIVYNTSNPIISHFMGSYQSLSSGHVLLGHGQSPTIEEFNASGDPVMTAQFGELGNTVSYRAFRSSSWVGRPNTKPSLFACNTGNETTLYMSWNGATEYTHWVIHSQQSPEGSSMKLAAEVKRMGFETVATIPRAALVRVEAKISPSGAIASDDVVVQNFC